MKIHKFTSHAPTCPQCLRLGPSPACWPCPPGCPPSTSPWPFISPCHPPSPPFTYSKMASPFRLLRPTAVTWYLTYIFSYIPDPHLWADSISAFKIYPESKCFSSPSLLQPFTLVQVWTISRGLWLVSFHLLISPAFCCPQSIQNDLSKTWALSLSPGWRPSRASHLPCFP